MLKKFSYIFSFAIGTLVLMTSLSSNDEGNPAAGKKLYTGKSQCITCHGPNGKPTIVGVPNFSKGERMEKTNEQLAHSIKTGVAKPAKAGAPAMPPYGGGPKLTEKQIEDLLSYVRSLKKK